MLSTNAATHHSSGPARKAAMYLRRFVFAALLFSIGQGAVAEEIRSPGYKIDVELSDCIREAGDDLASRRACYTEPMKLADSLLERAYDEIMTSSMPDKAKRELQDVQKSWKLFREADCNFRGDLPLNGAWPILAKENCYISHTVGRTNELGWIRVLHLPHKRIDN